MAKSQIDKDLRVLKLEEERIEDLSIRDIIKNYRKLAKKLHPDVSGYDSKEDFQELGGAYERLLKVVVDNIKNTEKTDLKRETEESEQGDGTEEN